MDDRDACNRSNVVHGFWRTSLGSSISWNGKTSYILTCGLNDAACNDWRWLCRKLLSAPYLPLLYWLG